MLSRALFGRSGQFVSRVAVNGLAQRRAYAVPKEEQDLVVIGAGPGGYVAAIKAGQMGKKVTCIERRDTQKFGGTCLNVGCIPSKALLHASHMYEDASHNFAKYGVIAEKVSFDLEQMMKSKEKAVNGLTGGIQFLFKKNKVNGVFGHGSVVSPNEVKVVDDSGKEEIIKTKNILIATGSDVASLPGIDIDEKTIISSTGALSLSKVPEKMVVIGGGVIGLELGSVWSRLGAKVTVVEYLDRIAAGADGKIADEFKKILGKQGMEFKMETKVESISNSGSGHVVHTSAAEGGNEENIEADVVLVSVGRRPYTDNLGLENVGIELERGRVPIDDEFRTSVPSIRAIGDVVRGAMLAHKAEEEGIAAVEHLFTGAGHVNYDAIPSVIYTNPELAWVGKTEEQCKEEGIAYNTGEFPFMANSRARTNDQPEGLVKVIAAKDDDRLLGVHILGQNAGELIAEAGLAMEYGASSEDVARTCHAHPTLSEAVKEAAMGAYGKPIHS